MLEQRRETTDDFLVRIDGWVRQSLRFGSINFAGLLHALPGVYPTQVLASVERLAEAGAISPSTLLSLRAEAAIPLPASTFEEHEVLPPPHPLDFEWRFDRQSVDVLLDLVNTLTRRNAHVLLYGTPAVALAAVDRPPAQHFTFVGVPNTIMRALQTLNMEAGGPIQLRTCTELPLLQAADAVLLDPPWYTDFIRPMLAAAARCCRVRGYVIISLPPEGTRATAPRDRIATLRYAKRIGLSPAFVAECSLPYSSPYFERNALCAVGIRNVPRTWRRGDLVILCKNWESRVNGVAFRCLPSRWHDLLVGRTRFFVDLASRQAGSPAYLRPLVSGQIVPTVSRREHRAYAGNVWSAGNRAFSTSRPDLVREAALRLQDSSTLSNARRTYRHPHREKQIEDLMQQLARIAEREEAEQRDLGQQEARCIASNQRTAHLPHYDRLGSLKTGIVAAAERSPGGDIFAG